MQIITLDQRTPEWHTWRSGIIGSSDAPAIMGVSPWSTVHKLWELKTGRREPQPDNPWMARGRAMEEDALEAWSEFTGETVIPMCVRHEGLPFVGASLDGATFDGALLLEIKCPGEKDHAAACATGAVPKKYWPQVQHQLACVPEADLLHYWSYRPDHAEPRKLIEVRRDQAYIDDLLERETRFWEAVQGDYPPAGDAWEAAEQVFVAALDDSEEAEARLKDAREHLLELIPQGITKQDGALVSASLTERAGNYDYKAAFNWLAEELSKVEAQNPAVADILTQLALQAFRKKATKAWYIKRK